MARSFARDLALWMCAAAVGACAGQERNAGPNSSLARTSAAPSASSAPVAASSADVEALFAKKTIDQDGDGCGPPTYDGWYTRLIYGGEAQEWKPTVTDVHTDPTSGRVLQEGVGDANFIVVAVDNQQDHAAYVGPVYSYYEFTHSASDRLTDEQWRAAIARNDLPPRPNWWSSAFPAKPPKRELADAGPHPNETDPRVFAVRRMYEQLHDMPPGAERDRLRRELQLQSEATRSPPLTKVPAKSE